MIEKNFSKTEIMQIAFMFHKDVGKKFVLLRADSTGWRFSIPLITFDFRNVGTSIHDFNAILLQSLNHWFFVSQSTF